MYNSYSITYSRVNKYTHPTRYIHSFIYKNCKTQFFSNVSNKNFMNVKTKRSRLVVQSGIGQTLIELSDIVGRSLILFVFFASSFNWLYYRNARMHMEENDKTNSNKTNKANKANKSKQDELKK